MEADIVWAAIETLDVALQHIVLRELASEIAMSLMSSNPRTPKDRIRAAVAALWEAFEIYQRSPSVKDYRRLAEALPELNLPRDSSIRPWLGGGWNDCLRHALLPAPSDGDFVALPLDSPFSLDELCELLRVCAAELGRAPRLRDTMAWSHRPDVLARFERLPRSYQPFARFGGYRPQAYTFPSEPAARPVLKKL